MVDVKMLGPLAVHDGIGWLDVPVKKERLVLAALTLAPGQVVTVPTLIERLWPDAQPRTAKASLRNYVSSVRKTLNRGSCLALETAHHGYVLHMPKASSDVDAFHDLRTRGRAALNNADGFTAVRLFEKALNLWRGPVLADLSDLCAHWPEVDHFGELRLRVIEDRIEADLRMGRHRAVVANLERLVLEYPGHEGFHRQRILALHRDGRQVHAIQAFADARRSLCDQLGREPGPQLIQLHQAILEQRVPPPSLASAASIRVNASPARDRRPDEIRPIVVLNLKIDVSEPGPMSIYQKKDAMRQVLEEIGRADGWPVQVVGSLGLVIFGALSSHGDDLRRALEMALAIKTVLRASGASLTAAVTHGRALIRTHAGPSAAPSIVSDAIIECGKLLEEAPLGAIYTSDVVHRASSRMFSYEPVQPRTVWALVDRMPQTETSEIARFIGRETEMGLLDAVLRATSLRSYLLTITGPAGIGKSRLVAESLQRYQSAGRPLAVGWFRVRFLGADRVHRFEPPSDWGLKIAPHNVFEDSVVNALISDANDVAGRWRDLEIAVADGHVAALVIDDVHLGGRALLNFIESFAGPYRNSGLVVIAIGRSDLYSVRPDWGGGRPEVVSLRVPRLSPDEVRDLVPDRHVDCSGIARVSDGIPWFALEYAEDLSARAEIDTGIPPELDAVPISVLEMLGSLLAALDEQETHVLRAAAINGIAFNEGEVTAAVPDNVKERVGPILDDFLRRELIVHGSELDRFAIATSLLRRVILDRIPRTARPN